jgi:hypothetical protein
MDLRLRGNGVVKGAYIAFILILDATVPTPTIGVEGISGSF